MNSEKDLACSKIGKQHQNTPEDNEENYENLS